MASNTSRYQVYKEQQVVSVKQGLMSRTCLNALFIFFYLYYVSVVVLTEVVWTLVFSDRVLSDPDFLHTLNYAYM